MMAATHGPSGTLAGLAVVRAAQLAPVPPLDPTAAVVFVVAATAGAMLPDADHPSSATSRLWGPLTGIPCRILGRVAGGHRAGTHDVSRGAPLLFAAVAVAGLLWPPARLAAVAVIVGLALAGLAPLIPGRVELHPVGNLAASWAIAWTLTPDGGWPPLATAAAGAGIAVGVLAGIAGDACTPAGVPWRGRDVHLLPRSMRPTTGKAAERWLIRPLVLAGVLWLGVAVVGPLASA